MADLSTMTFEEGLLRVANIAKTANVQTLSKEKEYYLGEGDGYRETGAYLVDEMAEHMAKAWKRHSKTVPKIDRRRSPASMASKYANDGFLSRTGDILSGAGKQIGEWAGEVKDKLTSGRSGIGDTLSSALTTPDTDPQSQFLAKTLVGAGVGGGIGLLSGLNAPRDRRRYGSRFLTGAALGGIGGAAWHGLSESADARTNVQIPENVQVQTADIGKAFERTAAIHGKDVAIDVMKQKGYSPEAVEFMSQQFDAKMSTGDSSPSAESRSPADIAAEHGLSNHNGLYYGLGASGATGAGVGWGLGSERAGVPKVTATARSQWGRLWGTDVNDMIQAGQQSTVGELKNTATAISDIRNLGEGAEGFNRRALVNRPQDAVAGLAQASKPIYDDLSNKLKIQQDHVSRLGELVSNQEKIVAKTPSKKDVDLLNDLRDKLRIQKDRELVLKNQFTQLSTSGLHKTVGGKSRKYVYPLDQEKLKDFKDFTTPVPVRSAPSSSATKALRHGTYTRGPWGWKRRLAASAATAALSALGYKALHESQYGDGVVDYYWNQPRTPQDVANANALLEGRPEDIAR